MFVTIKTIFRVYYKLFLVTFKCDNVKMHWNIIVKILLGNLKRTGLGAEEGGKRRDSLPQRISGSCHCKSEMALNLSAACQWN